MNKAKKAMIIIAAASLAGFMVWQIMKGTVIQRQYDEIKQAKDI